MTATNHGLFGAIIAISLQKYPAVAIALAPISHFLIDAIPHFGDVDIHKKKFYYSLITDMVLAITTTLLIAWAWQEIALLVIACAFLAASPDLMWYYYEYMRPTPRNKRGWLAKIHTKVQWSQTNFGIIYELAWFLLLFPYLLFSGM